MPGPTSVKWPPIKMVSLLKTPEGAALSPRFQDRVSRVARMANGISWGYRDHVTVLARSSKGDERRGLLFGAKVKGRKRLVPAHEVYPVEQKGRNATVLSDYREWWPGSLHDDEW